MSILKLHDCRIAKRGKGAKGSIAIQTYGVPVVIKDSEVVKDWDYSKVAREVSRQVILDEFDKLGFGNELLLASLDWINRSKSLQANSEQNTLALFIMEKDLAQNEKEAKDLASIWQQTRDFMKRSMMAVPSVEDLAAQRQKVVDKLKSENKWKLVLVTPEEKNEEKQEDTTTETE